jgi:hypothetical protein
MEKTFSERMLEIIPGFLTWLIILFPVIASIFSPILVAAFIIIFDFYWLVKAMVMGIYLISGYRHMKRDAEIDWLDRCRRISEDYQEYLVYLEKEKELAWGWRRKKIKEEINEVEVWLNRQDTPKNWHEIFHVVMLPFYKESYQTMRSSVDACARANFPKKKMIIILGVEERAGAEALKIAEKIKEEYQDVFYQFMVSLHPGDIVGEIKGKGSNANWMATKVLKPYIDQAKIPYENILVSIFDGDTRPNRNFFSCITYKYIINPNRVRRGYQPIPLYSNNIWHVPAINRLVAFGSSFWQMIESTRPYRMVNFSSQVLSFQTLYDIDFWDTTIVSEDSRHYYRAILAYGGDYQVVPIFIPVYMDAVLAGSFWETLKNQYLQKQRWAWGIEHFPYFVKEAFRDRQVPFFQKIEIIFRLLEGHISWSTASLLIATAVWFPYLLNPAFSQTVLGSNMPVFARTLLMITWIGIVVSMTISLLLLPKRPKNYPRAKMIFMLVQWVLIPISAVFFGSIPAIDAQTRLMINKPLGFRVTEKKFAGTTFRD